MMRRSRLFVLILCGTFGLSSYGQTATLQNVGWLNDARRETYARGVSPDGQTITGDSFSPNYDVEFQRHVFRWTPTDGIQDLGIVARNTPHASARGRAVAANGVIVGESAVNSLSTPRAFRLAPFGTMQDLGSLAGRGDAHRSVANGVSDNGNVVVGQSHTVGPPQHAFRWYGPGEGVMEDLDTIDDAVGSSAALACSANGSTIVGWSWNGAYFQACIFRPGQPVVGLPHVNYVGGWSRAHAVSADGSIIVGEAPLATGMVQAFRWTEATGMVDLGTVNDAPGSSSAYGVSANGRLIVGSSSNGSLPGGDAAIWIDGVPRQLWDVLVNDYKLTPAGWTDLQMVAGCSRDGRVLVGSGRFNGSPAGFRLTLDPNAPPRVVPPQPITVECTGEANRVTLLATVDDADAEDRLTVTWSVGGVVRQTTSDVVPGSVVSFAFDYSDGETPVMVSVSDGKAGETAETAVTVSDTRSPIVIVTRDVRVDVDRGRVFASRVNLGTPFVEDACDPSPEISKKAKRRYPIGTTIVRWTVRDRAGNVATAIQRVRVVNKPPHASAGANVTERTPKSTARVRLDGRRSYDPNGHRLKYRWKAPGIKFSHPNAVRPSADFPVGTTIVTLTVFDEAGARSTDTAIVRVVATKSVRTAAAAADASLREASTNAADRHARGQGDALSAEGLSLTRSAIAIGVLAGDDAVDASVRQVANEEALCYLALRSRQTHLARMAGQRFYDAFLSDGDPRSLAASMYAYYGSGMGFADLASTDVHEAPVDEAEARDPVLVP